MSLTADTEATSVEDFAAQWHAWHTEQEARTGDRHGFLAVTSINWLDESPQRFADAPGEWWSDADGVHLVLADDEEIVVAGSLFRGRHNFGVIRERDGVTIGWKDSVIEVAKRGGYDIVRPRHPDAPLVTAYSGTPTYDPAPSWAVTGRYVSFGDPRAIEVDGAVDRVRHVYYAPGRIEFEIAGESLSLTVFANEHAPGFFALFTDQTSGVTTYAANRSLAIAVPDEDGTVLVDFNRAVNLPCAYTDLATCPLPPAENRLPIPIEAGEKTPYERVPVWA